MEKLIVGKLQEIEEKENIRILLAVESGSRAWGFASPDSDYDVRFIYIRRQEDYLRLDPVRDVIELPINDLLDINGWDLQKSLRLLYKSNPTIFEWFMSPIVYMETEFADRLRGMMNGYFSAKRSLYHYMSMAEGNYRAYLKRDLVCAKKYFYVLRPVLACRWILERRTPSPMRFSDLVRAQLPDELADEVGGLLEMKIHSPEIREIPRIDRINAYFDACLPDIKRMAQDMGESKSAGWQELNEVFLQEVRADAKYH